MYSSLPALFLAVCLLCLHSVFCQPEEAETNAARLVTRHPYMANVRGLDSSVCSGVLIGEFTVLTAAQCVDPRDGRANRPTLWLNSTSANELSVNTVVRETVQTVFHPNYTGNAVDGYNLAILRLNESTMPLRPMRLLVPGLNVTLIDRALFVLSFGRTSLSGARTLTLQIGEVNVVDPQQCINADIGYLEEQMFCVDRAVPCSGDLGGPAFVGNSPQSDSLFGLVSGTACFENVELSGFANAASEESIAWLTSTRDLVESQALEDLGISSEDIEAIPVIDDPFGLLASAEAPDSEDYYDILDIQVDE